jgi:hypothetical protein
MEITENVMAMAWAAIFVMLAVGGLRVLSQRWFARPRLPFFAMLERRAVTYEDVEQAIGPGALARAMQRCIDCGSRYDCGWRTVECLNAELVTAAASRTRAAPTA